MCAKDKHNEECRENVVKECGDCFCFEAKVKIGNCYALVSFFTDGGLE